MSLNYLKTTYSSNRAPQSNYPNQFVNYLINRFNIQKGDLFLEIGCGRGDFLQEFSNAGMKCSGIDLDPDAQNHSPSIDIKLVDITKDLFPFEDNTFDIIYHKSVIEHVYSPIHLMKESLRVLKPGGKLIILTPDWVSQMKVFYEDITHCRPYDISALNDALHMFNMNEIHVEKFRQLPILWNNHFLTLLAKLLSLLIGTLTGRKMTKVTGIKFFRWSVELMILGYGEKKLANKYDY